MSGLRLITFAFGTVAAAAIPVAGTGPVLPTTRLHVDHVDGILAQDFSQD